MHPKSTPPRTIDPRYFDTDPNPSGLCLCGCGQRTKVATFNNAQTGYRKGHHKLLIQGHKTFGHPVTMYCETCGSPFQTRPSKADGRRFCSVKCAGIAQRGEEGLTPGNIERFWTYVDTSGGPDACWNWQGTIDRFGYGFFSICQKQHRAHRISAELAYGPCPEDRRVCHHCDNTACVNPAHLYYGTAKDNTQDAIRRGRFRGFDLTQLRGEKHNKAKLTEAQVIDLRRRWAEAPFNMAAEARKLGVATTSVEAIIKQKNWRFLPSVEELKRTG